MNEMSCVVLRHVVPEMNKQRQYTVAVGRDLFGTPMVTCLWGRIGRRGQQKDHPCKTIRDAEALAAKLVHKRERRGYRRTTLGQRPVSRPMAAVAVATPCNMRVPQRRRPTRKTQSCVAQLELLLGLPARESGQVEVSQPRQSMATANKGPVANEVGLGQGRVSVAYLRERAIERAVGPVGLAVRRTPSAPVTDDVWRAAAGKPVTAGDKERALDLLLRAGKLRGLPLKRGSGRPAL